MADDNVVISDENNELPPADVGSKESNPPLADSGFSISRVFFNKDGSLDLGAIQASTNIMQSAFFVYSQYQQHQRARIEKEERDYERKKMEAEQKKFRREDREEKRRNHILQLQDREKSTAAEKTSEATTFYEISRIRAGCGKYKESLHCILTAIELWESINKKGLLTERPTQSRTLAQFYYWKGYLLYKMSKFDKSLLALDMSINLDEFCELAIKLATFIEYSIMDNRARAISFFKKLDLESIESDFFIRFFAVTFVSPINHNLLSELINELVSDLSHSQKIAEKTNKPPVLDLKHSVSQDELILHYFFIYLREQSKRSEKNVLPAVMLFNGMLSFIENHFSLTSFKREIYLNRAAVLKLLSVNSAPLSDLERMVIANDNGVLSEKDAGEYYKKAEISGDVTHFFLKDFFRESALISAITHLKQVISSASRTKTEKEQVGGLQSFLILKLLAGRGLNPSGENHKKSPACFNEVIKLAGEVNKVKSAIKRLEKSPFRDVEKIIEYKELLSTCEERLDAATAEPRILLDFIDFYLSKQGIVPWLEVIIDEDSIFSLLRVAADIIGFGLQFTVSTEDNSVQFIQLKAAREHEKFPDQLSVLLSNTAEGCRFIPLVRIASFVDFSTLLAVEEQQALCHSSVSASHLSFVDAGHISLRIKWLESLLKDPTLSLRKQAAQLRKAQQMLEKISTEDWQFLSQSQKDKLLTLRFFYSQSEPSMLASLLSIAKIQQKLDTGNTYRDLLTDYYALFMALESKSKGLVHFAENTVLSESNDPLEVLKLIFLLELSLRKGENGMSKLYALCGNVNLSSDYLISQLMTIFAIRKKEHALELTLLHYFESELLVSSINRPEENWLKGYMAFLLAKLYTSRAVEFLSCAQRYGFLNLSMGNQVARVLDVLPIDSVLFEKISRFFEKPMHLQTELTRQRAFLYLIDKLKLEITKTPHSLEAGLRFAKWIVDLVFDKNLWLQLQKSGPPQSLFCSRFSNEFSAMLIDSKFITEFKKALRGKNKNLASEVSMLDDADLPLVVDSFLETLSIVDIKPSSRTVMQERICDAIERENFIEYEWMILLLKSTNSTDILDSLKNTGKEGLLQIAVRLSCPEVVQALPADCLIAKQLSFN